MKEKLLEYLEGVFPLDTEKFNEIAERIPIHSFDRETVLVRQGEYSSLCFLS